MKNLIALAALAFGIVSVSAQQSIVNVKLYPIQTIVVNPGNKTVDLEYHSEADYNAGVDKDVQDHLTVYSTGAFAVSVKSDQATLTNADASITESINASDIYVTASTGSTNGLATATYNSAVSLTETAQELFSSSTGGVNKNFNVNYAAKGDLNAYVNKYFNAQNPTVYTTTVTYSIEAK